MYKRNVNPIIGLLQRWQEETRANYGQVWANGGQRREKRRRTPTTTAMAKATAFTTGYPAAAAAEADGNNLLLNDRRLRNKDQINFFLL